MAGRTCAARRGVQLSACVFAMMAIANLQYAWTLFTIPVATALEAKLSAVQLAFTLFILVETWLVPVEGYLIDRLGPRMVVSVGGALVGLAWIGSGLAQSLAGLYFWYALGGAGAGGVYGAAIGTALKWFPDCRGLAVGVVAGAYGAGTALTVLPIEHLIETAGYRTAFIVGGALQAVVVLVAAQVMRKPPQDHAERMRAAIAARPRVHQAARSATPIEMVRAPAFWLMYLMMTVVAFGGLMVTAQLRPIAATYGMDRTTVWFGVSALAAALVIDRLMNGITRPFWGFVSDRVGRCNAMAAAFAVEAAAVFMLLWLIEEPIWFVILSGAVFFAWGEIYSLFPAAIADVFGPDYATTNYGILYTAKGTAAILAGWGAALLVESTGSWVPVFWTAAVFDLFAAALAFFWLEPLVARLATERRAVGSSTVGRPAVPRGGHIDEPT